MSIVTFHIGKIETRTVIIKRMANSAVYNLGKIKSKYLIIEVLSYAMSRQEMGCLLHKASKKHR